MFLRIMNQFTVKHLQIICNKFPISRTYLITRRLTAQEWQEALILMKTHQMIELPSAIGNLEDDSPIYIYSTINIFCSAADINELVEMFKGETGETEEQKEAEYSEKTQDQWETQDEMRSE